MPPAHFEGRVATLFVCGDVMTGRGIDQVLPHPSEPCLHEPYVDSAREYVAMAENVNGRIAKPADFAYIWGDALGEWDRFAPDLRIVNLETSITESGDYEPKGINYRMHPENTPCLTAAGIGCCALANNHVLDWGLKGLSSSLSALRGAGITTAGAGGNLDEALRPAVNESRGSRVLVFAVATEDSGVPSHWAATNNRPGIALLRDLSRDTASSLAGRMRANRQPGDLVVLSIHWGGNWGYEIPAEQRAFAHILLDSGSADVIYGHSSHHPKAIEVYSGRPILYGCGDFLNDYEGIPGYEHFRSNLVLMYFISLERQTGELAALRMVPLRIRRFRLEHVGAPEAEWLRDMLNREGKRTGTEAVLGESNTLDLRWQG